MRIFLVTTLSILVLCGCQEPAGRSEAFLQSYYRGLDLLERYRLKAAERTFAHCVRLEPEAAEGYWQLGRVRLVQGRIEEGVGLLEQAAALDPELTAARSLVLETFLGRGKEALEEGEFEQAEGYLQRALAVDPQGYESLYWAAIAAQWQKDYARADSILQQAVAAHPEPLELRWHLKWVQEALGRPATGAFADAVPQGAISGRFSEIGVEAGVDKFDGGRASAWADYDEDGDLDLVVIGHPALAYFRNDGARFAERTQAAGLVLPDGGIGVQTADYDNDGDADLYVTRDGWFGGGVNLLFQNDGRGVFADVMEESGTGDPGSSFCAAWSDFDRDGYLDIYVANGTGATGDSTNVLYRNQGDGTFGDVAATAGVAHKGQTLSTAWGDFDGDGWPDLYACNFTEPNVLFRNLGDGTFADQTAAAGVGAEHIDGFITFVLDYDNDGALDIFVGNWSQYAVVLADRVAGKSTSKRDRPVLFRNQGDGTFTDATEAAGLGRALGTMSGVPGDVDNDGWVDIYLGNGGPQMGRREPDVLFRNRGDGTFADATAAAGLGHLGKSHGVTFADYDRDGDLDLYAPVGGAQPGDQWPNAFYRSEGFGNHYLSTGVGRSREQSRRDWCQSAGAGRRLGAVPGGGFWIQLWQQQQLGVGIWVGGTPTG